MRVLLISDNVTDAKTALQQQGWVVRTARDADAADADLRSERHDVIVFDTDSACLDVLRRVRRWRRCGLKAYLVVLASRLPLQARVDLLDAGVDCCLLKPNHGAELLARLRGLRQRRQQANDAVLHVHDLEIDLSCRIVKRGGRTIPLTPREYSLLRYLAMHRGQIVPRAMILEHVYDGRDESNVVNVYIRYLRNKIDKGFEVPLILTRYGQGYMLRGEVENESVSAPFASAAG